NAAACLSALPAASARLRQGCLRLREPEGHAHGTVELNRCGQCDTRLLPLSYSCIQRPKAAVAVRLKRAHAQFLGQGERLAVVADGGLALAGCLARRALAQEPQRPGLVAVLLVLAGIIESLRGALVRVFQAARQQIRLAKPGNEECQTPRS